MKSFLPAIFIVLFFLMPLQKINAQKLAVIPYVSGINYPIDVKNCGDDRLFIADKGGLIRIINADGTLRTTPFLDISSKMVAGSEDGLMGIVFSPNYKTDGKFYVDYIGSLSGDTTSFIEEYKVSAADSNLADVSSELTILTQAQPFNDHVAGNLMFGKDGYLYINFGDGDAEEDPNNHSQDSTTFWGKILRIDISNSSLAQPYVVPPTNAFYNNPNPAVKKEIWALGVRNPFRSSIDRITGDAWIADVGQYHHEEVDYQPVNAPNGKNYGWNIMEGSYCFKPPTGCNMTGLTLPIYDYPHAANGSGAIIGGYVYRSAQSKALFGTYLFADLTSKWIDGIQQSNGVLTGPAVQYFDGSLAPGYPISFGEDRYGDEYILYNAVSTVYKLVDTSYQRYPKAYYTPIEQGGGSSYLLQGLQGVNLTYQWLKNNVVISGATLPDFTATDPGIYSLVVTNTLGLSDTSDVFPFGSLLLNLISFTAQKTSLDEIKLQWETSSEQNISGYTIQRKKDNETVFSNIGFIDSKAISGTSNNELGYAFTDSSAFNYSKIFYRLQIENKDGSFTYSNIVLITSDVTKMGYNIFPNPAKGQVQLYLNQYTQPVLMMLYDNAGKTIKQQLISQQTSTIDLPASKGVYIIQMSNTDGSNRVRKKLLVE